MQFKGILTGITCVLGTSVALIGQTPSPKAPEVNRPTIREVMKKSVVFLQSDCRDIRPDGTRGLKGFAGTAFLLVVPDPRLNDRAFSYIVTNRHVAQPGSESGHPCMVAQYSIRMDTRTPAQDGSYSVIETVPAAALRWEFSSDPSVDLAVSPIGLDGDKFDIAPVPVSMLLDNDSVSTNHIAEGDSVVFAGLFIQLIGQTHSEPIVREGKVAMVPREQVPTTIQSLLGDVYLVDVHVFGGNSGSPMFVSLDGDRNGAIMMGLGYRLLGVVSGYVNEDSRFELQPVASYAGTVTANSGVAMVVPAQKILEIINSPRLKEQREKAAIESHPHSPPFR